MKQAYQLQKKNEEIEQFNSQLKKDVALDPLTGLHNRRFLDEVIKFEAAKS